MATKIVCADVLEWCKNYTGSKFHALFCDPSYALSKKKKIDLDAPIEVEIETVGDLIAAYHSVQQWGDTGFMGKEWDTDVAFNPRTWAALAEHLLPGAFLFVFASSRGWHRLACAMEDAGLILQPSIFIWGLGWVEMPLCLGWVTGSSFPKATRIDIQIEKQRNDDIRPICRFLRKQMNNHGLTSRDIAPHFGFHPRMVDHWAARNTDSQPTVPTWEQWEKLKELIGFDNEMDAEVKRLNGRKGQPGELWYQREIVGKYEGDAGGFGDYRMTGSDDLIRRPATDLARAWEGHRYGGQILKDALTPIIVAQKPWTNPRLDCIVETGAGALWVDGGRIAAQDQDVLDAAVKRMTGNAAVGWKNTNKAGIQPVSAQGRWPSNFCLVHVPPDENGEGGCRRILKQKNPRNPVENGFIITIIEDSIDCDASSIQELINSSVPRSFSGTIMMVRRIELNDDIQIGEEEINDKCTMWPFNNILMNKVGINVPKSISKDKFRIRNSDDAPLDTPSTIQGHRRENNASPKNPSTKHRTADVVTGGIFEPKGPYFKLFFANRTGKLNTLATFPASEFVRTLSRASGMLAESEFGISNTVDCITDGTNSIMPWHIITSRKDYTMLLQYCQIVDAWECVESCPARKLGEQSGYRHPGMTVRDGQGAIFGSAEGEGKEHQRPTFSDKGTAARYFFQADWEYEETEHDKQPIIWRTLCDKGPGARFRTDREYEEVECNAGGCVPECPVAKLDEQAGDCVSSGGGGATRYGSQNRSNEDTIKYPENVGYGDKGGRSRFFHQSDWSHEIAEHIASSDPVRYVPKAARKERNQGLNDFYWRKDKTTPIGFVRITRDEWEALGEEEERIKAETGKRVSLRARGNIHPTLKPINLCKWIATLALPPKEYAPRRILIPFAGTGSEMIGALLADWEEIVGIDFIRDYCDINETRVEFWVNQSKQLELL